MKYVLVLESDDLVNIKVTTHQVGPELAARLLYGALRAVEDAILVAAIAGARAPAVRIAGADELPRS